MATATKDKAELGAELPVNVFRLNFGQHIDAKPGWQRPVGADGKPLYRDPDTGQPILEESHVYKWNEEGNNVIRTHKDLAAKDPEKFTLLSGAKGLIGENASEANRQLLDLSNQQAAEIKRLEAELASKPKEPISTDAGLTGLRRDELLGLAAAEKVDVADCRDKDDLVFKIMSARRQRASKSVK